MTAGNGRPYDLTKCEYCGADRDEITGILCYRCRSRLQEREMEELREEIIELRRTIERSHDHSQGDER